MVRLLSYPLNEILMKDKCKNCGKLIEVSNLTHCSNVCLFEDYLKSKSFSIIPMEKKANPT